MKKALMITATISIVLIAGAMIYYFIFFKPGIERDAIKIQEQKLEFEKKDIEKLQNNKVTLETTISDTEVDKFNSEIKDLVDFLIYYGTVKKEYEDAWSKLLNNKYRTVEEILKITTEETNSIKQILIFPESMTKYINFDLSYIQARSTFFGELALISQNGKIDLESIDVLEVYPNYSQDLTNMGDYLDSRDNELRNILINYNNHAKELGLPTPFPNQ